MRLYDEFFALIRQLDAHHIPFVLHRFAKIEGEDYVVVDLLIGQENMYLDIIRQAEAADWQEGQVRVARREDLVRMKRIRNSDQDQVDIKRLTDDED